MKYTRILCSALLVFLAALPLLAQAPPPPPATPIDGGLSLLVAAGGLYGIKKIRDRRKG